MLHKKLSGYISTMAEVSRQKYYLNFIQYCTESLYIVLSCCFTSWLKDSTLYRKLVHSTILSFYFLVKRQYSVQKVCTQYYLVVLLPGKKIVLCTESWYSVLSRVLLPGKKIVLCTDKFVQCTIFLWTQEVHNHHFYIS